MCAENYILLTFTHMYMYKTTTVTLTTSSIIAAMSFVELAKEMIQLPGVKYFLSEKLNQDPLEEHFSKHRAAGGHNDNPSVYEYGFNELALLQAAGKVRPSAAGNCRNNDRAT